MRKRFLCLLGLLWLVLAPLFSSLAQLSSNMVNYQVTYDSATQVYTAWVVPGYAVPNTFNSGESEQGATAQFTLVVPRDFVITAITDIRGVWMKPSDEGFIKLGPGNPNQDWPGFDPSVNYYVIGKSPTQTDYGSFTSGVPVALFSFVGNGCFGSIFPLPAEDPFIAAADSLYKFNVGNSFYSLSGQPSGGNVVPLEQYNGMSGEAADCAPSTIVAIDDINNTLVNTPVRGNILTNDADPDGDTIALNLTPVVGPTNGAVVLRSDGSYLYTPNADFVGEDSFIYSICDDGVPAACDEARVVIRVLSVPLLGQNTLPVAVNDNYKGLVNRPVRGNVLPNDFDPDDNLDSTSVRLVSGPTNGTLALNPNGTFIYTPTVDFVGTDVFSYRVCDTATPVLCAQANVTIRIKPRGKQTNVTFAADNSYGSAFGLGIKGDMLDNDYDPEENTQTVRIVVEPLSGSLIFTTNGVFDYMPQPSFAGPDRFVYVACDNGSPVACDTATVYLLVYPVGVLGDFVWKDINNNGLQDSNEPGVNGVTMRLWSADASTGTPVAPLRATQTSGNGRYVFDGLRTGDYMVQLDLSTLPDSCVVSSRRNVGDSALDNDFGLNGLSGVVRIEALASGLAQNNTTIDAGLVSNCVRPVVASVVATAATCNGTVVGSDGSIALSGISRADRYSLATTVGGLAAYGSATAFMGSSLTIGSLPNPTATTGQAYVIRLYNGSANCFTDVQVTLPFRACSDSVYDVSVSKSVDKAVAMLGETVRYELRVANEGTGAVSGVVISDVLNAGVGFLSSTASVGSYDATTKRWTIGNLAVGQVATLSIEVRVLAPGVWFNEAALIAINEDDTNPSNDKDRVCFTAAPYLLCRGQGTSLELTVPSEYTGVVWFRKVQGGQPVQVGTGNRYIASEDALGSYEYTFTASQGTCPAEGCCPILVVVEDCCPVEICIPVTIQKRRR